MWNSNQSVKNGVCVCTTKKCKFSAKKKNGNGNGDCRRISVAVFGTGKVLIAGAKNNDQLYDTYNYIVSLLQENYREIVQFSVEDKKKIVKNSGVVNKKLKPIIQFLHLALTYPTGQLSDTISSAKDNIPNSALHFLSGFSV